MNVITEQEYNEEKRKFFRKHNNDFECETQGSSAEYYRKTYVFKDRAIWYEVMQRITYADKMELTNKKCIVPVMIDLMEIEFWTNENSESTYYYEPWDVMYDTH